MTYAATSPALLRSRPRPRHGAALVAAALVTAAAPARAEVPAKARELATEGRTAHDHGDYARAIAAFKEAYVIAPAPALLFNLAQAYRLQGNCVDAAIMYRRFLSSYPRDDARALARTHLASIERCAHDQARAEHAAPSSQVAALPGALGTLVVDRPRAPGRTERQLGVGFAIGGAAALTIAAYYGWRAHDAAEEVERGYANGVRWRELAARDAEGARAATLGRVFGVGGGLAVASGVTLYLLGRRAEHAAPLAIVPVSGGAQATMGWRF